MPNLQINSTKINSATVVAVWSRIALVMANLQNKQMAAMYLLPRSETVKGPAMSIPIINYGPCKSKCFNISNVLCRSNVKDALTLAGSTLSPSDVIKKPKYLNEFVINLHLLNFILSPACYNFLNTSSRAIKCS